MYIFELDHSEVKSLLQEKREIIANYPDPVNDDTLKDLTTRLGVSPEEFEQAIRDGASTMRFREEMPHTQQCALLGLATATLQYENIILFPERLVTRSARIAKDIINDESPELGFVHGYLFHLDMLERSSNEREKYKYRVCEPMI